MQISFLVVPHALRETKSPVGPSVRRQGEWFAGDESLIRCLSVDQGETTKGGQKEREAESSGHDLLTELNRRVT